MENTLQEQHTSQRYNAELEELRSSVLTMGGLVEQQCRQALEALVKGDEDSQAGWLRVRAGRHYPTDVLAGAALGTFIGWLVPRLHEVDHPGGGADKAAPGLTFAFRF